MSWQELAIKYRYYCFPLWAVRLGDRGRYLLRKLLFKSRYSLADQIDSLSCHPMFIISAGRSGTTLLRSMLVAGGQIGIPPETQVVQLAVRRFSTLQYLGWADLSRLIIAIFESHRFFKLWEINLHPAYQIVINLPEPERSLSRIIDEVFKCYSAQHFPEATVWGDQSPIHTFYWPWILATFPKAKYLHLVRDGRDAIASLLERGKYLEREMSLEEATHRWIISVHNANSLKARVASDQFLEIHYEELVTQPVQVLHRVSEFVGIEYREKMLDFWKLPTTVEHRTQEYHRNLGRPISTASIGKWAERLSATQQQYILAETAPLLEQLGYQV